MAEVRRGTGPEALPFGAASELNRAAQPQQGAEDFLGPGSEIPVQFETGETDQVDDFDTGTGENMQVLLEPPNPAYRAPVLSKDRPGRVPQYVVRNLPQLMAAARNPEAPIALKALFNMVTRQLEQEMRRRG